MFRRRNQSCTGAPIVRESTGDDLRIGCAFVFSGGGNLGAAQVGAMQALLAAGIRPDALIGCSVGALNAAYMASDPTLERAQELAEIWSTLTDRDVFGSSKRRLLTHLVLRHDHLFEGDVLRKLIRRFCPLDDLADAAVPLWVVSTDLDRAAPAWHATGPAEDALAASAALPGLFPPVHINGHLHVDGGVLDPVPVRKALSLGYGTVYVLDVSPAEGDDRPHSEPRAELNALEVLLRSFEVSRFANRPDRDATAGAGQRIVRMPMANMSGIGLRDFTQSRRLIVDTRRICEESLDPTTTFASSRTLVPA